MKRNSKVIVPGFSFSGIAAGIKQSGDPDLAIIKSDIPCVTAGVFTTNRVKAAPVRLSMRRLARMKQCQAIVVNSGNANACTGQRGMRDARAMTILTARSLGIAESLTCVASTGIIGRFMPMGVIEEAIPEAASMLSPDSISNTARAIMTTDTFPKIAVQRIGIGGRTGTIAGIAKGAGMICPSMATMLCFLFTDLAISHEALVGALKSSTDFTFNRLTVDNDMSTNDTVMIMANGLLGNRRIDLTGRNYRKFEQALTSVTSKLAGMIAEDGEGATGRIRINVERARSERDAVRVARAIAESMLVKTAIYGKDPNWGRIIAAAGRAGARMIEEKTDILINGITIVRNGTGTGREEEARAALGGRETVITVRLNTGRNAASILTCDLTEEYIRINAHYTT
jgi:glutamate N-acetyltransferase/amino-acid N-acetyltransferase